MDQCKTAAPDGGRIPAVSYASETDTCDRPLMRARATTEPIPDACEYSPMAPCSDPQFELAFPEASGNDLAVFFVVALLHS